MKNKIRYLGFIAMSAAVLSAPFCFSNRDEELVLSGVEASAQFPEISIQGILSGQTQEGMETYMQQRLPGKPFLVRLRNQIMYSVFHTVPNNNFSMNKDKNLFTWGNVSAYMQYDEPMTDEAAMEVAEKAKQVKELLNENGKQLYVFLAPCKVRSLEEELPWIDRVMAPERKKGDYEELSEALTACGVEYFDGVAYMENHEFDSRVPLYYNSGVHWSLYAGNCVGAALGDFLEEKSGYNLPEMKVTAVPCETPLYPDADAYEVMNLLQAPSEQYYQPVIEITDETGDAPGVLFRGDSFMGQTVSALIQNHYFGKNVYMENVQIFTDEFQNHTQFHSYDEVDMKEYLKDIDIVVLEANEPSMPYLGFGLMDYLLEHPEVVQED